MRWEDLDRWKWVVIDVGVILDTSASHSENIFLDIFGSWVGDHSARPQGAIRILTFLVRPWDGGAHIARVQYFPIFGYWGMGVGKRGLFVDSIFSYLISSV